MEDIIYTERLELRKWIDADFIPFAAMNKDAVVMKYYPSLLNKNKSEYKLGDEQVFIVAEKVYAFHSKSIMTYVSFKITCAKK